MQGQEFTSAQGSEFVFGQVRRVLVPLGVIIYMYSETWELETPKGLSETVLNSKAVLFLRLISMY